MSDKKEKKVKLKKVKNIVNNEIVTKKIPDSILKDEILDIEFEPFNIGIRSKIITRSFGKETNNLEQITVEFFYNDKFNIKLNSFNLENSLITSINEYFITLKRK